MRIVPSPLKPEIVRQLKERLRAKDMPWAIRRDLKVGNTTLHKFRKQVEEEDRREAQRRSQRQLAVEEAELAEFLALGWAFKAVLPSGRVVIENPAPVEVIR